MKKLLTIAALVGATSLSFAQGTVNFANTATTLVSAGGVAIPGPSVSPFIFGVFLAPSTTTDAPGTGVPILAPQFQTAGNYASNAATAGRIQTRTAVDVGTSLGLGPGSTVDFIVRVWSANAGATWQEALASWNNGAPLPHVGAGMWLGQSVVGNNIVLGGGPIPNTGLFGAGLNQIQTGFDAVYYPVPEPTSMALAGLGAAAMLIFRRRK
jgi:hypothetical protein